MQTISVPYDFFLRIMVTKQKKFFLKKMYYDWHCGYISSCDGNSLYILHSDNKPYALNISWLFRIHCAVFQKLLLLLTWEIRAKLNTW